MGRRVDREHNAGIRRFVAHLESSSLGSPAAAALREGMSRAEAQRVIAYSREITRAEVAERKRFGGVLTGGRSPAAQVGGDILVAASGVAVEELLTVPGGGFRSRPHPDEPRRSVRQPVIPALAYCWVYAETRAIPEAPAQLRAAADKYVELHDRYAESIAMLGRAVEIDECEHAAGAPNHLALGTHLLNRALARNAAGQAGPAQADLRRCVEVVELGQDDLTGDHSRLAALAAKALHTLGIMARQDGDVPGALRCFDHMAASCSALPRNTWLRMQLDQAEALLAAGLAIEATRHLDYALARVGRSGDDTIIADAHALRSAVALAAGDRPAARRDAIRARRRFLRLDDRISAGLAGLVGLRAEVLAVLDRGSVPMSLVSRARSLAGELARLRLGDEAAVAKLLIVRLELVRGGHYQPLPTLRQLTTMEGRMLLRLCRAQIAAAIGDRRTVLGQARAALAEVVEPHDAGEPVDRTRGGWADLGDLCRLALGAVSSGAPSARTACRLFEWSERIRTRVRRRQPLQPVDDPVLAQQVQEYRRLGQALREARVAGRPWRELATRRRALRGEMARRTRPTPVTARLDEVAARLGDRALVSYVAVGEEILAVVVADGRTSMARLGPVATAFAAARELHADLAALSPDGLSPALVDVVSRSARCRARRLDEQLVRPLHDVVGDRELVLVPTGMLFAVAWGALPSLTGRPLTVVPSATSWLAAVRAPTQPMRGRTVLVGGPGLSPAAVGEIGRLRQYRPDAWLLDGGQATTAIVLDALDGAWLAHLVAHGAHEPQNSLFSHLELADGAVYAHEMARLARPPEHLVLAACELAFSQSQSDCDVLGFAGVLLEAGSRTVVAAVSQVGDESAAAAMAEYHRRLASGALPAEALAASVAADPLRRPFLCVGASVSA